MGGGDGEWLRWGFGLLATVVIAMFSWLFKVLGGKANRESTDKRFDAMMAELREQRQDLKLHETEDRNMHKDVLAEIRETNRHLSMTNSTLSNLVGRFDGQMSRNGDRV